MAIATILDFFGFAAVGFVLMAAVGIQALVAMFSSVPLTRRHVKECPQFNAERAYHRIRLVVVLTFILVCIAAALVVLFAPTASVLGFLLGLVLAFGVEIKRMCPDNERNRKSYECFYADCYPHFERQTAGWTPAALWRRLHPVSSSRTETKDPQ